jgi:NAD+ synthase (glutamine-hydrolysing)
VPKTLIQHLIRWVAASGQFEEDTNDLLREIVEQEITPELIPTREDHLPQATEDSVGPYSLQDFTLFHVLRYGFPPSRIAFLARHAWADEDTGEWPPGFDAARRTSYDLKTIRHWLEVFLQRFFAFSQFKRSALPNGPKVVAGGSLSPRSEWRAPSDANARVWLDELYRNVPES